MQKVKDFKHRLIKKSKYVFFHQYNKRGEHNKFFTIRAPFHFPSPNDWFLSLMFWKKVLLLFCYIKIQIWTAFTARTQKIPFSEFLSSCKQSTSVDKLNVILIPLVNPRGDNWTFSDEREDEYLIPQSLWLFSISSLVRSYEHFQQKWSRYQIVLFLPPQNAATVSISTKKSPWLENNLLWW